MKPRFSGLAMSRTHGKDLGSACTVSSWLALSTTITSTVAGCPGGPKLRQSALPGSAWVTCSMERRQAVSNGQTFQATMMMDRSQVDIARMIAHQRKKKQV